MKTTLFTLLFLFICFIACSNNEVAGPSNTAPSIEDQVFEVADNSIQGYSIGIITATDADNDSLQFEIIDGNSEELFSVVESTGELILSGIFADPASSYDLLIQVTDGLNAVEATITVRFIPTEITIRYPAFPANSFFDGRLQDADYWSDQPEILSAGLGFSDNQGIEVDEITEALIEQIGGAWASNISCEGARTRTLATTRTNLEQVYSVQNPYADEFKEGSVGLDAIPVTLSWPVRTNTIDLSDFRITVSNGDVVSPSSIGVFPNFEINERNVIILMGEFANKRPSNDPESRYVSKVEIVGELILVGPNGQEFNAQGLVKETFSSPYDVNNGPRLIGAKLNYSDPETADGPSIVLPAALAPPPNHEYALYGEKLEEAELAGLVAGRLRVFTSGGFSPNGIQGVLPTDYQKFFRVHARSEDGNTVLLEETNVQYMVEGGTLEVIGLSDLGGREGVNGIQYGDCYAEDGDNYIDIILTGDDAALRSITHVEVPSLEGGYSAFFNPGGPGPTPYPNIRYTTEGPADLEPVIIALDNPMRVSN